MDAAYHADGANRPSTPVGARQLSGLISGRQLSGSPKLASMHETGEPRAYALLEARFRRIGALEDVERVLDWDRATMMPQGGAGARSAQISELRVLAHEMLVAPEVGDWLDQAEGASEALSSWQRANLREMRRAWRHATALSADLVERSTRVQLACEMRWRKARPENDFAALAPFLTEVVATQREVAEAKSAALGLSPYDALLDSHDPGLREASVSPIFDELGDILPELLGRVLERQAAEPAPLRPPGPFPADRQRMVGQRFMRMLGFSFEHRRLDVSHHPFTGGVPDDIRITTRYDEEDFGSGLMAVLHETGHAMYERGLPDEWRDQPVGRAASTTLHESQSLLIEMQACRSREFIARAAPILRGAFGGEASDWEPENLRRLLLRVGRGLIRVNADEVSYPLHVILRFRLERAMISGELVTADLPEAWDQGMRDLVGVSPPDDRDGCLQDIHWPLGVFGYFPTYTLGALAAAQIFEAANGDDGEIRPALARGDFAPLLRWLREKVHAQASLHPAPELIDRATGSPLTARAFLAHLERRYLQGS
jgi:carboxypeptidase Taq